MSIPKIPKYCCYFFVASAFLFLLTVSSCDRSTRDSDGKSDIEQKSPENPEVNHESYKKKEEPTLRINYRLDSFPDRSAIDSFHQRYSEEQKILILALNRIDPKHFKPVSSLIIPDTIPSDIRQFSPFPDTLKILSEIPKTVIISQRIQAFSLYEFGKQITWGPVSSGKKSSPTPNGIHYGNFKAKRKISSIDPSWILPYYFNFMNFEGVGVHQYALPGYPASHACVRLRNEDAKMIYDWAKQWTLDETGREIVSNGTPFLVFGEYNYEKDAPWLELINDPEANDLSESEMAVLDGYLSEYYMDPRNCELE